MKAPTDEIEARLTTLQDERDELRKQLQASERRLAQAQVALPADPAAGTQATEAAHETVIVQRLDVASTDALRAAGDALRKRYPGAVILLAAVVDDKPAFLAMAGPEVAKRCPAGDVVRAAAEAAGGGGGGRPRSPRAAAPTSRRLTPPSPPAAASSRRSLPAASSRWRRSKAVILSAAKNLVEQEKATSANY